MDTKNPTKITTGKVRFSYAHVWEPKAVEPGDEPKYSVCLLIPKSEKVTLAKIKKATAAALENGREKFGGKIPKNYKDPLRDGDVDKEDNEEYRDHYFINCSSKDKPQIVDSQISPILEKDEFYSGCYGRASVNFYAFNTSGNKGVAVGLKNLQKIADGERLSGGYSDPEDDFAEDFDDDDLL